MCDTDKASGLLFSYVDLEERIPPRHPLHTIRHVVTEALVSLDAEFESGHIIKAEPCSHSSSFDHRRRPETFLTAIATAFFCPTRTTSFLPRVTPV